MSRRKTHRVQSCFDALFPIQGSYMFRPQGKCDAFVKHIRTSLLTSPSVLNKYLTELLHHHTPLPKLRSSHAHHLTEPSTKPWGGGFHRCSLALKLTPHPCSKLLWPINFEISVQTHCFTFSALYLWLYYCFVWVMFLDLCVVLKIVKCLSVFERHCINEIWHCYNYNVSKYCECERTGVSLIYSINGFT